jgi:hypothetical protein
MRQLLLARCLCVIARSAMVCTAVIACADPAFAYRPFNGTDAAVAEPGEFEIEFQPLGRLQQGSERFLVAPTTTLNLGLAKNWEGVVEGRLLTPLSSTEPPNLTDAGAFLKHVLRPGSLQDRTGPSIATEFGVLFPDSTGSSGFGASWAGIVSQRWDWGTVNFNVQTQLTREQHADLFISTIVEGPHTWMVRPVTEIFYENEFGQAQTFSGLVGLIWQVRDSLSFDAGIREATTNGRAVNELRAGFTIGFPLSRSSQQAQK